MTTSPRHSQDNTVNAHRMSSTAFSEDNFTQSVSDTVDSALHIEDNPFNLPNTGDLIEFWDHEKKKRYVARVLNMHPSARRRWPGWRNVMVLSSQIKMAINLDIYSDNRLAWRKIHTLPEEDGNLQKKK